MTDSTEFRKQAHRFIDWMADYFENIEQYPVKSQVQPGGIFRQLPSEPPEDGEDMNDSFNENMLQKINTSGKIYLTHTRLNGKYVLRMSIGQT